MKKVRSSATNCKTSVRIKEKVDEESSYFIRNLEHKMSVKVLVEYLKYVIGSCELSEDSALKLMDLDDSGNESIMEMLTEIYRCQSSSLEVLRLILERYD